MSNAPMQLPPGWWGNAAQCHHHPRTVNHTQNRNMLLFLRSRKPFVDDDDVLGEFGSDTTTTSMTTAVTWENDPLADPATPDTSKQDYNGLSRTAATSSIQSGSSCVVPRIGKTSRNHLKKAHVWASMHSWTAQRSFQLGAEQPCTAM